MNRNIAPYLLGILCLMIAGIADNITIARGGYGGTLRLALAFTILADLCFLSVFFRGGWKWKVAVLLMAYASAMIYLDIAQRAPHGLLRF